MKVDFCLPVKNEEQILESNLNKLLDYLGCAKLDFDWRIVVLINGSDDRSWQIAENFKQNFPNSIDFRNYARAGRGAALKAYWTESDAEVLAYMDADLSVSLGNIPALVEPLIGNKADLDIGSRLLAKSLVQRSWYRELISRSYNQISRLMLGHNYKDLQCGFKAIRKKAFVRLYPYLENDKWFFDTELAVYAQRLDLRVLEIPVDWSENRFAKRPTTVKLVKDSWRFLINTIGLRKRLASQKISR